jgi:hypothetical protein
MTVAQPRDAPVKMKMVVLEATTTLALPELSGSVPLIWSVPAV